MRHRQSAADSRAGHADMLGVRSLVAVLIAPCIGAAIRQCVQNQLEANQCITTGGGMVEALGKKRPVKPIRLYDIEGSPQCRFAHIRSIHDNCAARLVREALSMLDIAYEVTLFSL